MNKKGGFLLMKIKKLPLVAFVVALMLCFSAGLMAAPLEHDVTNNDVVIEACEGECPGHIIKGVNIMVGGNIQILDGSHKISLDNTYINMAQTADDVTNSDVIQEYSALYIAEGVENVEITLVGFVYLSGAYGVYSLADELSFTGDETTTLYVTTSLDAGMYSDGDLTFKGGTFDLSSGAGFVPQYGLPYRYALSVGGMFTVEDALLEADGRGVTEYAGRALDDGALPDDVVICGIRANEMKVVDSEVKIFNENIAVAEGYEGDYLNIALDVISLDVENSVIKAEAGKGSHSYGIRCGQYANIKGSEVTATGGAATWESLGLDAYYAMNVYADESTLYLNGGKSDYISAGGDITKMEAVNNSSVYADGGEAKRYSSGMVGVLLNVENSNVHGYGDIATDTDVVDGEGVFSEGLYFVTIDGKNCEIYGEAGKALASTGISATEITIDGGLIYGYGSDEGEDSVGIYLVPDTYSSDEEVPTKFEITNGNVIAIGGDQGFDTDDAFAGISYKADENATPEVKTDFEGAEFYFGNTYKMVYNANGVKAENMPADEDRYYGENFLISKKVPTADGFKFLYWSDEPDGSGNCYLPEDDNMFGMNNEGYELYAIWECAGGADCPLRNFSDLDATAWYHDGICFCLETGLMMGTGATTFEPNGETTRAMIVTTLYRMNGEPGVETAAKFSDVKDGAWYADAVAWAYEIGLAEGYEDGTFRPDRTATREELAAFLFRMAACYGEEATEVEIPAAYTDKDDVSDWAVSAMAWAVDSGIITGMTENTLVPQGVSTRAQLATMLERFELSLISEE